MSRWQRIGVYAAGLALDDAGLAGKSEVLEKTHLLVAAGNGDRDCSLDSKVLEYGIRDRMPAAEFNEALLRGHDQRFISVNCPTCSPETSPSFTTSRGPLGLSRAKKLRVFLS
jgi:hypothetical protein